jgi:hypothetical protein
VRAGREQVVPIWFRIGLRGLIPTQAVDLARDDQVFVLAESDAVFGGETFRALCHKIDVRALAENLAGGAHGIAQALDTSDASGAECGSVHDESVELDSPVAVQEAAASGIEGLIVFHDDDGLLDGIDRRAAALEHAPSRSQRVPHALYVGVDHLIRHGPRAAMNHQNRICWQELSLGMRTAVGPQTLDLGRPTSNATG